MARDAIGLKVICLENDKQIIPELMGARAIQEINDKMNDTNWREGNGRPTAEQKVKDWQKSNPDGKKADCIRQTGLSKKTVYKWWTL